ncbi:MAG: UDP-glycosyltransferase [Pseudomonadota bacterium]
MAEKVLLVAYGGGHITMVMPVMRELQARGVQCTLLALTTGYAKAQRAGLNPVGYRDLVHLVDSPEEVMAWGERLAPENSHPEVDHQESILYLGVGYMQWVRDHGAVEAERLYRDVGRRGFLPLSFMSKVIQHFAPDAVVTTNSPRTEQASIEAAVALGIPVLAMIDLFGLAYDPFVSRTIHADRTAVISEAAKRNVVAAGFDPARVVVTGNPAFDSLVSPESRAKALKFVQELGWAGKKIVLLAGQLEELPGTPEAWQGPGLVMEAETLLRQWVSERDDRALIVRYHPNEFQSFPVRGEQPRVYWSHPVNDPLHPALLAAQVVIVQTSTVGLEAVISGARLLSLSYSPAVTPERWDYGALGLGVPVEAPGKLVPLLEDALRAPPRSTDDYCVGRAAANVARETISLFRPGYSE